MVIICFSLNENLAEQHILNVKKYFTEKFFFSLLNLFRYKTDLKLFN